MSYVQDNLMPNEKVLFWARIHPAVSFPTVLCFLLALGFVALPFGVRGQPQAAAATFSAFLLCTSGMFFAVAMVFGLQALIRVFTTEFGITTRRVIAKSGFLRSRTLEVLLSNVENVMVEQNLVGRLLDFGTVTVIGAGGTRQSFRLVAAPMTLRMVISQAMYWASHSGAPAGLREGPVPGLVT
jgi:uncharacterized membrane protein YdbT with pleckstrin-like domain